MAIRNHQHRRSIYMGPKRPAQSKDRNRWRQRTRLLQHRIRPLPSSSPASASSTSITIMALGFIDKFDLRQNLYYRRGQCGHPPRHGNHRFCRIVRVCRLRRPRHGIVPENPAWTGGIFSDGLVARPHGMIRDMLSAPNSTISIPRRNSAFNLSERVPLADSPEAEVARALYS